MQALDPGAQAHFVCADRAEEAEFLRMEDLPFTALEARLSSKSPLRLLRGYFQARALLSERHPDVVFGKGGALSAVMALAAHRAGIPVVLHESDAVSGRANRLVARWARVVCLGFRETAANYERGATNSSTLKAQSLKLIFTGNPVRQSIGGGVREEGFHLTGLSGKKPVMIVFGGSQGAAALNNAVRNRLDDLLEVAEIIHLTGKGKEGEPRLVPGYWSTPFAHADLKHLYAAADFALSRAGAGGISELACLGIPALLVPLRGVAQDHQLANAEAAERGGGCRLLPQEALRTSLLPAVRALAQDARLRASMSESIRTLCVPDAAQRIARLVLAQGERKPDMRRS